MPGRTISTNAVTAPGPEQKYPYQDVFEDLEITFLCTTGNSTIPDGQFDIDGVNGLTERRYMDAWIATVCDQETMVMGYCSEYKTRMELFVYDDRDVQLGRYIFDRCYPIQVGPVEFSHESSEPATFSVTFNYDRWNYNEK